MKNAASSSEPSDSSDKNPDPIETDLRETLKIHLQELTTVENDPFEFQLRLINMANELNFSLEDCRLLWEQYHGQRDKPAQYWQWLTRGGIRLNQVRNGILFLSQFSILFGVILFFAEADKRQIESRHQAWQVINRVPIEDKTSAGRIEALEQLNRGCQEIYEPHPWWNPFQWSFWRDFSLTRGFYAHCISLSGLSLPGVQLSGINLEGADLQQAVFTGSFLQSAQFAGANLEGANFDRAQLNQANLQGAKLSNAQFTAANLANANLNGSNLIGAQLSLADLSHADLRGIDLTDASLDWAILQGSLYDCQTQPFSVLFQWVMQPRGGYFIDANPANCTSDFKDKSFKNLESAQLANTNLQKMDLSGYNLKYANLQNADLSQAQLTNSNLSHANLRGTQFQGANLAQANLKAAIYDSQTQMSFAHQSLFKAAAYWVGDRAQLAQAQLQGADLRGATLQQANLTQAQLQRADLRAADLSEADLTGAKLQGTIYDIKTIIPPRFQALFDQQAYRIDVGTWLEQAQLAKVDLRSANLYAAHLQKANFAGANLGQGRLNFADLRQANLKEARLGLATLTQANLAGANLSQSFLVKAHLEKANLSGANLSQADLREADLTGANLQGANLTGANLTGVNLAGANLTGARLEQAIGLTAQQLQQAKNGDKLGLGDRQP